MMSCGCEKRDDSDGRRKAYEYAVKFVVGEIPEGSEESPLPVGAYFTKINIHNFSRCDCVTFRWKVAVGLPHLRVGPTSELRDATLCPDEAAEIVTSDIIARIEGLKPPKGKMLRHTEGWVVIESPVELDVVAVYGTAADGQRPIGAFHTERVSPRCVTVCDDFHLEVSTGVAAWEYQGPGDASFSPTWLTQPRPGWASAMAGSVWVVPGNNQKPGAHSYRLRFKLCFGFRKAALDLRLMADNFANVFLNGTHVAPAATAGNMYTSATVFSTAAGFKAGDNELLIVVTNTGLKANQTGLDVLGSIFVEAGLCEGAPMPLLSCPQVCYRMHDREFWWNPPIGITIDRDQRDWGACAGETAGVVDGRRRAEQFEVTLGGSVTPGTLLEYRAFTKSVSGTTGWSGWMSSGYAGNVGQDHAITAIEVRLVTAPVHCHVRYRVCTRSRLVDRDFSPSWSGDVYDGATAGSTGGIGWPPRFPPIVALQVEIV
jgi:hypothetical protein